MTNTENCFYLGAETLFSKLSRRLNLSLSGRHHELSIKNSKRKQNKRKVKIIPMSYSEQDEKVQSAGKKHSWKKTCTVNKKGTFGKLKGNFGKQ